MAMGAPAVPGDVSPEKRRPAPARVWPSAPARPLPPDRKTRPGHAPPWAREPPVGCPTPDVKRRETRFPGAVTH